MRQLLEDLVDVDRRRCHHGDFFSSARTRSRKRVEVAQGGGVLLPRGIVVEGKRAAVEPGFVDRTRRPPWRPRCRHRRRSSSGRRSRAAADHAVARRYGAACDAGAARDRRVRADAQLWPIWTWLSILTPSPITVSSRAPRSMRCWRRSRRRRRCDARRSAESCQRAPSHAMPKPSAPITAPEWTMPRCRGGRRRARPPGDRAGRPRRARLPRQ